MPVIAGPGVDVVADRRASPQAAHQLEDLVGARLEDRAERADVHRPPGRPASTSPIRHSRSNSYDAAPSAPMRRRRGRGPGEHVRVARQLDARRRRGARRAPGRARRRPTRSRTAPAGPAARAPRRRWRRCRRRTPASTRRPRARCRPGTHPPPARRVPWDVSTMRTWRSTRSTPTSDVPPFEQLRAQIATRAASGDLPAGTRLPTVRALAAELGLAANTVAKAYRALETDGVITTEGRRGTFDLGVHGRRQHRRPRRRGGVRRHRPPPGPHPPRGGPPGRAGLVARACGRPAPTVPGR